MDDQVLTLAAQIVSSHVSHNQMSADAVVGLVNDVIASLRRAQIGPSGVGKVSPMLLRQQESRPFVAFEENVEPLEQAAPVKTANLTKVSKTAKPKKLTADGMPAKRGRPRKDRSVEAVAETAQDFTDQNTNEEWNATSIISPSTGEELVPAVPISQSVFPDYIVCLEDGKRMKMLKRHLASSFGMTPDEYRAKWGLPDSYPMTAPNYTAHRSELAKTNGLGTTDRKSRLLDIVSASVPSRQPERAATA